MDRQIQGLELLRHRLPRRCRPWASIRVCYGKLFRRSRVLAYVRCQFWKPENVIGLKIEDLQLVPAKRRVSVVEAVYLFDCLIAPDSSVYLRYIWKERLWTLLCLLSSIHHSPFVSQPGSLRRWLLALLLMLRLTLAE